MRKPREQKASSRRDAVIIVTGISLIGMLVFRLVLGKLIGDKGLACFGMAYELYFVIAGTVSYGLSEAVSSLVRYRVRRGQYKSAQKVLGGALLTGCLLGAVLSVGVLFAAQAVASGLFRIPMAGQALGMAAPAIFFSVLTGVFRGYFQGNGARVPVMHSQILQIIFTFIGGLVGVMPFRDYGVKVSALLQNVDYASAYGAMGACAGILFASVLVFLHVLVIYFLFRHNMQKQAARESQKSQDGVFYILHMILGTGGIYALYRLLASAYVLVDAFVLFRVSEDGAALARPWGAYYGKAAAVIGIVATAVGTVCLLPVHRIMVSWERNEERLAREKLGVLIHQCAVVSIPAAVFSAVLAENLLNALFDGDNHQTALWIQAGCIGIVFFVFAAVFMEILLRAKRFLYAVGIAAGAFALQLGVLLFLIRGKMGIMGLMVSYSIFYLVIAGCGFWVVMRLFRYRQEWIRTFAVTAISAAISGVFAMLLNRVIAPLAGALFSILVSLAVAVAAYLVLLTVLRAFRDDEMDEMAGGFVFRKLAELLHIG